MMVSFSSIFITIIALIPKKFQQKFLQGKREQKRLNYQHIFWMFIFYMSQIKSFNFRIITRMSLPYEQILDKRVLKKK